MQKSFFTRRVNCALIALAFIISELTRVWTSASSEILHNLLFIINIGLQGIILFLLGGHVGVLRQTLSQWKLFAPLVLISLLLQFFYSCSQQLLSNTATENWFEPQGINYLTLICLIGLSLIQLGKLAQLKLPGTLVLGLLLLAVVNSHQTVPFFLYLTPFFLVGYFNAIKHQPNNTQITNSTTLLELWFFTALLLTGFMITWDGPFTTAGSSGQYGQCFIVAAALLGFSFTTSANNYLNWWLGWTRWITGTPVNINYQQTLWSKWYEKHKGHVFYRLTVYGFVASLRFVALAIVTLTILELPVRAWDFQAVNDWAQGSLYFVLVTISCSYVFYWLLRTLLRPALAIALTIFTLVLISSVNYLKLQFLGVPFMPSDIHLFDQAFASLIFIAGTYAAIFIYAGIFILVALFFYSLWKFSALLINSNKLILARGLITAGIVFWFYHQPYTIIESAQVPDAWAAGNSAALYEFSGVASGFIYGKSQLYIAQPTDFSPQSTRNMALALQIASTSAPVPAQRPHIIVIQSEAFWDPGNLHPQLFPQGSPGDLESLCQSASIGQEFCQSGYVQVPVFGGSTANTEFEFLTGFSLQLFPGGTMPFVHYLQKPVPSIVWRLQQAQYHTLAIHPNSRRFWNRDQVYPLLGFNRFKDIDAFEGAERNEYYVNDSEINRLIIQTLKTAKQPQFIFSVTMANHSPFADQRYGDLSADAIDWTVLPELTDDERLAISTYSIGVRESRSALKTLITEYQQENAAPVIIVFYGDHLPILGQDYSIYHKAGFKTEAMSSQFSELYSTPYLVWSNQAGEMDLEKFMPVTLLGQRVTQLAGLPETAQAKTIAKIQTSWMFTKPTRAQVLANRPVPALPEHLRPVARLYRHSFFDGFFTQQTPEFFGITLPLIPTPNDVVNR